MKKTISTIDEHTTKFLKTMLIVWAFMILDFLVGVLSIIMWIITQNHAWGFVLAAVVFVYLATYWISTFLGLRHLKKDLY